MGSIGSSSRIRKQQIIMDYHTKMSFIKSGIRITGYVGLLFSIPVGAIVLIVAQIIGILEERK